MSRHINITAKAKDYLDRAVIVRGVPQWVMWQGTFAGS
jgi:hypothetical protein